MAKSSTEFVMPSWTELAAGCPDLSSVSLHGNPNHTLTLTHTTPEEPKRKLFLALKKCKYANRVESVLALFLASFFGDLATQGRQIIFMKLRKKRRRKKSLSHRQMEIDTQPSFELNA